MEDCFRVLAVATAIIFVSVLIGGALVGFGTWLGRIAGGREFRAWKGTNAMNPTGRHHEAPAPGPRPGIETGAKDPRPGVLPDRVDPRRTARRWALFSVALIAVFGVLHVFAPEYVEHFGTALALGLAAYLLGVLVWAGWGA